MSRRMSARRPNRASQTLVAVVAAWSVWMIAGPAAADEIPVPTDPIAKAAFDSLSKNCARCHQVGRLVNRERPAKGFGNILMLNEIAETPSLILPGNPHGSKLFKEIADEEMPYDVMYEGATPVPTEQEIKAIADWISSLGTGRTIAVEASTTTTPSAPTSPATPSMPTTPGTAVTTPPATPPAATPTTPPSQIVQAPAAPVDRCAMHQFVTNSDIVGLIAADLDQLPKARIYGTRYLTLTNYANTCTKEEHLEVYRQGVIKLVNSLSRTSNIIRLETIDPDKSIIRININDLGWDEHDWETILSIYPYATLPDTRQTEVLRATGTTLPYVRADWFVFTASRPDFTAHPRGLYDTLLRLPKSFQELARQQHVDIEGDIQRYVAQRAGFQDSGVSRNNRLIERHPSKAGYFWTSYDFSGNKTEQNLFERPLGPGGQYGFQHQGGETIFSLPNGFQAYYLNKSDGTPLDKGPTTIVLDPERRDKTVTNGISCMGCHDQGMRKKQDQIRDFVLGDHSFPREVREIVEALYPPKEKMNQIIADDADSFANAMRRAGLDPTLKLLNIEMINSMSNRYETDVDIKLAAAEFGLTVQQFEDYSRALGGQYLAIIRRLEQGVIPRDQFEEAFLTMAKVVTDDQVVGNPQVAYVPPTAPPTTPNKPGTPTYTPPTTHAPSAPAYTPPTTGELNLTLYSDKNAYYQGERPVFTVVASHDCYLTLTNLDQKGTATVLLPNQYQRNNFIKAGQEVKFPGVNAPFAFRLKDKGIETVIAVCSLTDQPVDGIKHNFAKQALTEVPNYTRSLARAIAVEAASPRPSATPASPTGTSGVTREAITLQVQ